jgi:hypothetical protein
MCAKRTDQSRVLLGKLRSRDARIGIIGLGYVGLPLALAFVEKGFVVLWSCPGLVDS